MTQRTHTAGCDDERISKVRKVQELKTNEDLFRFIDEMKVGLELNTNDLEAFRAAKMTAKDVWDLGSVEDVCKVLFLGSVAVSRARAIAKALCEKLLGSQQQQIGQTKREWEKEEEKQKMKKTAEDKLDPLVAAIRAVNYGLNEYKDPTMCLELPFPYTGEPHKRVATSMKGGVEYFKFNGREKYAELYAAVKSLGKEKRVQLYGTVGFGKSYLLAALAVQLMSEGMRVVYLPDCRKMLDDPTMYMREALLLSLTVTPLYPLPDQINNEYAYNELLACGCKNELLTWRKNFIGTKEKFLLFLIGQISAFNPRGSSAEIENVSDVLQFLNSMRSGQIRVEESSANNAQAVQDGRHHSSRPIRVTCLGGLSTAEYDVSEYRKTLDKLTDLRREKVEDATGKIPLLLTVFVNCLKAEVGDALKDVKPKGLEDTVFVEVWQKFIVEREVRYIRKELKAFSAKLSGEVSHNHFELLLSFACEANAMSEPILDLYDARFSYFVPEDGHGACVCGLAREIMAEIVFEHERQLWRDQVNQVVISPVPCVLGFAAERASLASIACDGVRCDGQNELILRFQGLLIKHFEKGAEHLAALQARQDDKMLLAFPRAFNYKAVDAVVIMEKSMESKSMQDRRVPYIKNNGIAWGTWEEADIDGLIGGIQVTMLKTIPQSKFTSTDQFFASCDASWKGRMKSPCYFLLWVMKSTSRNDAKLPEQRIRTACGKSVCEFFVTFTDLRCGRFDV
eukprot:GHVR01084574.1.p1 GENE.GHVR01084574.1~~GHVR01084574.1.p1  ORF type:complete len:737 (+),score=79.51 GHVR01084574.1:1073-3283(+)